MTIKDSAGNTLTLIQHAVIVPVEHVDAARSIASAYMRNIEKVDDWQPEKMLPCAMSSTGQEPATYFACFREVFDSQSDAIAKHIAEQDLPWCRKAKVLPEDSAEEILGSFCVVDCTRDELLLRTALKCLEPLPPSR